MSCATPPVCCGAEVIFCGRGTDESDAPVFLLRLRASSKDNAAPMLGIIDGLRDFMQKKGMDSIAQLCGAALS